MDIGSTYKVSSDDSTFVITIGYEITVGNSCRLVCKRPSGGWVSNVISELVTSYSVDMKRCSGSKVLSSYWSSGSVSCGFYSYGCCGTMGNRNGGGIRDKSISSNDRPCSCSMRIICRTDEISSIRRRFLDRKCSSSSNISLCISILVKSCCSKCLSRICSDRRSRRRKC
jgi:hypothetical protein